jgi:hypothetical protein
MRISAALLAHPTCVLESSAACLRRRVPYILVPEGPSRYMLVHATMTLYTMLKQHSHRTRAPSRFLISQYTRTDALSMVIVLLCSCFALLMSVGLKKSHVVRLTTSSGVCPRTSTIESEEYRIRASGERSSYCVSRVVKGKHRCPVSYRGW